MERCKCAECRVGREAYCKTERKKLEREFLKQQARADFYEANPAPLAD